jgi:hypothetical protein
VLLAQRKEASVLFATSSSVRTLQLSQRPRLPMAKQNHHFGSRLCLQRHLQLYYTVEGAFPVQDLPQSDHFAAGKETGHCVPRCNLLLSAGLLDVGHDRLVTPPNSTTRTILTRARFQSGRPPQGRNHSGGERGRRQQRTLQFRRGGLARRLQHDRGGPDNVQVSTPPSYIA